MLIGAAGLATIPLRRNGRIILACTLVAAGLIVAADGLVGLNKRG